MHQRLVCWIASPQGVEPYALVVEIDDRANETMQPVRTNEVGMPQDGNVPLVIGTGLDARGFDAVKVR